MKRIIIGVVVTALSAVTILDALGGDQAEAFTEIPLWTGADVPFQGGGGVTADGAKLMLANGDAKLYIRDVLAGTTAVRELKGGRVEEVKPSPSGAHAAVTWWDDQSGAYQLRVITMSTLSASILSGEAGRGRPRPLAWTSDGRWVLAWIPEGAGGSLSLLSVSGEPARVVKRFAEGSVGHADIAPSGRWIAFDSNGLWLIQADGSGERRIVEDPELEMLGWFPSGHRVLFACTRQEMTGIWTVDVDEGRVSAPRFLKRYSARLSSAGFSRDGRFFAGVVRGGGNAYVMHLDPGTGRPQGAVALLRDAEPDVRRVHASWAPDSRRIAFIRLAALQPTTLVVLDIDDGRSRAYPLTKTNLGRPMWHPGGERIALHEESGQVGVFELDLRTGEMKQILGRTNAYEYLPDGEHIAYRRNATAGQPNAIVQRHLVTGDEKVMYVGPGGFDLASDGKSLLIYTRNNSSLWVAPVGGQARLVLAGIKASDHHFALSHDGRYAYFSTRGPWDVWRVSIEGGTPEPLGFNVGCIERLALRPDGRSIAVNGGCATGQVVMWRGFQP